MKLRLIPSKISFSECSAFIIKSASLEGWVAIINELNIYPSSINIYPLPGHSANSAWGCLIESKNKNPIENIEKFQRFELIGNVLFIPEYAQVYPNISTDELQNLMLNRKSLFHPEIGLVELPDKLEFIDLIKPPEQKSKFVISPENGIIIPNQIKSVLIKAKAPEEVLEDFEKKEFPKKEKLKDKPLNVLEKIKLGLYKTLFKPGKLNKPVNSNGSDQKPVDTKFTKFLDKFLSFLPKSSVVDTTIEKMQKSFEDLEERNQKELDKLIDMIEKDPAEALKYAIPLEEYGRGKSDAVGSFRVGKIWNNLSLFGNSNNFMGGGGGAIEDNLAYNRLLNQYNKTAQELIAQGDYKKAAFVYLKLTKNYHLAASTLEKGGYYAEAASIYLKYQNNTLKAAECFEKGHFYQEAIAQYKVNEKNEKIGDLFRLLNNDEAAKDFYNKASSSSLNEGDYCKAAEIQKNKLNDHTLAQNTLITAWDKNIQSQLSLTNLLDYSKDNEEKKGHIDMIFKEFIDPNNYVSFIKVMKSNYSKNDELSEHIKDITLETISFYAQSDVDVLQHLPYFNQEDLQIKKDVLKFGIKNRRRKRKKHS